MTPKVPKNLAPIDITVSRMDIAEFRQRGYLQEANRLFFHPLGLALEVIIELDGSERLGGIWDYRDDPEGVLFDVECVLNAKAACRIEKERSKKAIVRMERFGFEVQSV